MTRPPMAAETEPEIGGIVLAAGEGKRFGGCKQVARLDGRPLLEHAVRAMLSVPAIDPVVVVLGAHADEIRAAVDLSGADVVVCDAWADGQSASRISERSAQSSSSAAATPSASSSGLPSPPPVLPSALTRSFSPSAGPAITVTSAARPSVAAIPANSLCKLTA